MKNLTRLKLGLGIFAALCVCSLGWAGSTAPNGPPAANEKVIAPDRLVEVVVTATLAADAMTMKYLDAIELDVATDVLVAPHALHGISASAPEARSHARFREPGGGAPSVEVLRHASVECPRQPPRSSSVLARSADNSRPLATPRWRV